ncbi:transposase [Saccharopolyspora spinosa]|uniref:transposase n=1 Tax=Saccharopolyspora spinosa TaxID=60894 RepID=UPI00023792A3
MLRIARRSAVKARTQAMNQIRGLLVSAPAILREQTTGLDRAALIRTLARLRPGDDLSHPLAATRAALRRLARRHQTLDTEITELDAELGPLTRQAAPALLELFGVGPETAGQLLTSAGDNPERMRSEAAFAHLTAAAPIPASSGRTHRHRLNRGGDPEPPESVAVFDHAVDGFDGGAAFLVELRCFGVRSRCRMASMGWVAATQG